MKKSSITLVSIVLFTLYLMSPLGLHGIIYIITAIYPLSVDGITGSLWQDNIHIDSFTDWFNDRFIDGFRD